MQNIHESQESKVDFLNENFNNHYWNQIILWSIRDDDFLKKVYLSVPLDTFKSREKKFVMKMLYDFYDEFKSSPKDNFYDMFKDQEKDMQEDLYDRCMSLIKTLKNITGSNPEYIISRLSDALRHFYLEEASVDFAALIKRKKYDEAKTVILSAMRKSEIESNDEYYDYFSDRSYMIHRSKENKFKMKTTIPSLDHIIGGLNPPWLTVVLGTPKQGKSFWLLELSVAAIFQGLNVLFVSLEMDKNVVDSRLDQMIGFMSSRETNDEQEVMSFKRGKWVKTKERLKSIYNIKEVEKNRKRFKRVGGGGLKIVAHHRGRINYMDVERILNEVEERDGFIADVLVVDYLGVMKETAPQQAKKERISENCLGLKDLCGRRNLIGITAMQGNRKAMTARTFQPHMIADDIDCIHHADLAISICQTKKEAQENKYRLYGAIFRHGPQNWTIGLIRELNIGQIAIGEYDVKNDMVDEEEEETGKKPGSYF